MRIYLHSDRAEASVKYTVNVAPAADTDFVKSNDVPDDWKNADGAPKQIQVDFVFGAADVESALGKYMVARGIAHTSRMMRKVRQLFDALGRPITELFDERGRSVAVQAPE